MGVFGSKLNFSGLQEDNPEFSNTGDDNPFDKLTLTELSANYPIPHPALNSIDLIETSGCIEAKISGVGHSKPILSSVTS